MSQPRSSSSTTSRTSTSSSYADVWVNDQRGRDQILDYRVAMFCRAKVREMDAFLNNALRNSEQAIQAGIERTAVEKLVSRTFGSADGVSSSLVNWMRHSFAKQNVLAKFVEVRNAISVAGNGNAFRTACDELSRLIAHYFFNDTDWNHVEPTEVELMLTRRFLSRPRSTKEDDSNARRLGWAFTGMRLVGNDCSHRSWPLKDDQIRDVCSSVRSMTKALRYIAGKEDGETYLEPEPNQEFNPIAPIPSAIAMSSAIEDKFPSIILPCSPPASTASDTSECVVVRPGCSPPGSPPPPPESVWTTVPRAVMAPQSQMLSSFQTTRPSTSFKYFTKATTAKIPSLGKMEYPLLQRLWNHWSKQPKARLCLEPNTAAHECKLSHSLQDVFSCNPLYKLFPCGEDAHYPTSGGVVEIPDCPFLHVDVGFSPWWISDRKKGKRSFCPTGSSCDSLCYRSHSREELCLYNPWFKTRQCTKKGCRVNNLADSLQCSEFHEGIGDERGHKHEDDYVGMRLWISHIEHSHKHLIQQLKTLGFK